MNLGYFHGLISDLQSDFENDGTVTLLQALINSLQNQVNDPNNANHQTNVGNARDRLLGALEESRINTYPEGAKKALEEFDLGYFLPDVLAGAVRNAFEGNQITPQVALSALQKVSKNVVQGAGSIKGILDGFEKLGVETDSLGEGETEILVSIPRKFVDEAPSKLGEEFKQLEKLLRPFTELATGEYHRLKVREISSSDFLIAFVVMAQLHYGAKVVKAVAEAVSAVIKIYKDVADLRIMKAQLANMDGSASKKAIAELDKLAEKIVDSRIEAFAKELVDKYYKKRDSGRKAELLAHTKDSLKKIAMRVDRGFDFETRAGELPALEARDEEEGSELQETAESKEAKELREALEAISDAHREQLTFVREGEPILGLPAPDDEAGENGGSA